MRINRKELRQLIISAQQRKKEKEYWIEKLSGEWEKSIFPYDYPRHISSEHSFKSKSFQFADKIAAKLLKMSRGSEYAMNAIFHAVLGVLLSRYNNSQDIIVGIPIYKKEHTGDYINTVFVLRNRLTQRMTFKELLQQVKENIMEGLENCNYPLQLLVDHLNIPVSQESDFPLFDVALVVENIQEKELLHSVGCSIIFSFSISRQSLAGEVEYNASLYCSDSVARIITHFFQVLQQLLFQVNQPVHGFDILTAREKHQILYEFNNTEFEYPKNRTIHQLLEEQVERTPDHIAVILTSLQITYKELNEKSNQLAHLLKEKGVKPDTIVGIMVERSFEMFIGLLGILKAGGAFLPIDPGPNFPRERTDFMLADSGARILLTSPETRVKVKAEVEERFIEVIDISNLLSFSPSTSTPTCRASSANLAYVIYTSGSTGKPKGVMIHHQSVHNFIRGITQRIDFTPGKTILALTTISFDIFVLETLLPLSQGLRIVIANEHQQLEINILEELIVKSCVDMLQATPTRMRIFTGSGRPVSCLRELKEIMIGGEPFPGRLLGGVRKLTPARIYNMYGPTETTVWSTMKELTQAAIEEINIGQPILNTQIYILNRNSMLQPVGVIGHLCIGGDGLARGYLNRPELTTEKFTSAINDRLYMTGDLARWLPDGNIEFLGRIDHQVKIRGFRIELEEIETHLQTYDKIKEAVVLVKEKDGDKYLYAYIVPGKESSPNVSELRQYLSGKLPDYMIPSHFVALEKIPLTPNGKVSRKILYALDTKLNIASEYVPPKSELEKTIASVWQEVLKLDKVSINHNFFDLGGNSMSLIQVNNRLREVLGIDIRIVTLFRYTMIRTLARYLSNTERVNHLFQEEKLDALDRGKNKLRHLKRRMGNVMN